MKIITIDYSNTCGYGRVTLYNKPHKLRVFIHRLVMETFCGKSDMEVNHKDLNKHNNRLKNLEYVTRQENEMHSRRSGTKEYKPFMVVNSAGIFNYETCQQLATKLGVTRALVRLWLHQKSVTYFKYGINEIYYAKGY